MWRRLRLDYVAVALFALGIAVALRLGAFTAPRGTVSTGDSTSLPTYVLLLPVGAWFTGTVLSVRMFEGAAKRLPIPRPPRFGPIVRGILNRSLSRRTRSLVTGIVGVGLVVAFGVAMALFAASYESGLERTPQHSNPSGLSPRRRRRSPSRLETGIRLTYEGRSYLSCIGTNGRSASPV